MYTRIRASKGYRALVSGLGLRCLKKIRGYGLGLGVRALGLRVAVKNVLSVPCSHGVDLLGCGC